MDAQLFAAPPLVFFLLWGVYEKVEGNWAAPAYLTATIALVQPGIPQRTIWDPNEKTNRFLKLLQLSQAALAEKPSLLVWPETALPEMISRSQFTQDAIVNLLRPYKTWMVLGAADYESRPDATGRDQTVWFNSAFLRARAPRRRRPPGLRQRRPPRRPLPPRKRSRWA
jgi:apolipoprotein N-acyltransferase